MDGTLLNPEHQVSARFFELHAQLRQLNIQFVAASGRQYHSIVDKLHEIQGDIIVIAENGGYMVQNGHTLLTTPLPQPLKRKVLDLLAPHEHIHAVLCGKDKAYISNRSHAFSDKLREYYSAFQEIDRLQDHQEELIKIALFHFEDSEKYIYPVVKPLEDQTKIKISGQNWVDISDHKAHKGHALRQLMEAHQLGPDEVMVFGDYNNDLEMLALSNYSFAMANAHPRILETAKYRTTANTDFGVERILQELIGQVRADRP